ncbi:MAG: hypothetical protein WCG29_09125 [Desulfomonile sp.]
MSDEEGIQVSPELSQDFRSFEEFCSENTGSELIYFDVVAKNPLEMDPVTLAFSMRNLVRLSRGLMDYLLDSLNGDSPPTVREILAVRGIELDKSQAPRLRQIMFTFRDNPDEIMGGNLVKALQLMTIAREWRRVSLNLGESYSPPVEGWTSEDFGDDDSMLEAVRSVEDPRWNQEEES